jgi:hypothetical protein
MIHEICRVNYISIIDAYNGVEEEENCIGDTGGDA